MSVYVDPLVAWGGAAAPRCFRGRLSCHMYADAEGELHAMAARIGLKRAWFQADPRLPHYDLTVGRRALAVARGAAEHSLVEMARWMARRAAPGGGPDG